MYQYYYIRSERIIQQQIGLLVNLFLLLLNGLELVFVLDHYQNQMTCSDDHQNNSQKYIG